MRARISLRFCRKRQTIEQTNHEQANDEGMEYVSSHNTCSHATTFVIRLLAMRPFANSVFEDRRKFF